MLTWNAEQTPQELHSILQNLAREFPLKQGGNAALQFVKADDPGLLKVEKAGDVFTIHAGTAAAFTRGIALAMAGITGRWHAPAQVPALLIDCSDSRLYRPEYMESLFRKTALLGFGKILIVPAPEKAIFRYGPPELHRISECAAELKLELGNGSGVQNAVELGIQNRLWCDHAETVRSAELAGASSTAALREGACFGCSAPDSAMADLTWLSGRFYHASEQDAPQIFKAVFGGNYLLHLKAGEIERLETKTEDRKRFLIPAAALLWDDPLHAVVWRNAIRHSSAIWTNTLPDYLKLLEELTPAREDSCGGSLNLAWNICNVLAMKISLRLMTIRAYCRRDLQTLDIVSEEKIPDMIEAIEGLSEAFRIEWLRTCYPAGLEVMQIRLAGLCERYRELGRRLDSYLNGEEQNLPELELLAPETEEASVAYSAVAAQNRL